VFVRTEDGLAPIEATVIVAVALLAIAVLLPAIRKVKEQGNMTKCLANLGQWNPIISSYVEYHKWKDPRTIEFGKRIPPTAFSPVQAGNEDIQWAAVAMWGKEAMHR